MPNHLTNEISPYLLQHANNPVDWYPWNNQALSRAREEQKPIFLSIGYAACHWCHVMERETFEDVQVADFLNQYFISIKVDREERPDLDSIYMSAVVEMTQQGGWPMSVFLTPNLQPFYGGTYFPPTPRHGLPAFLEVLQAVQAAWSQERDKVVHVSDHILDAIRAKSVLHDRHLDTLQPKILSEAITGLLSTYDWTYGGWGRAPKFPQPMLLEILLLHAADGSQEAGQAVAHALDAMSRGGMYDVIGGGFHRYSTDTGWLVPHFEKMLYDNAQLALVYLHAYKQTNEIRFRNVAEDTLDFMLSEMQHPQGGFYTSIDADSIDGEGLFYTWKLAELKGIITNPQDWFLFSSTYDLSENGNFEGRIILQRRRSFTQTAKELNLSLSDYTSSLGRIHKSLEGSRQSRIRPQTDDKVITAWNGLAINAFIQAGRYLDRKDYLQAAQDCARFILTHLRINGVLYRSWRQGKTSVPGFLEDYGSLILSLISLYQSNGDQSWFNLAQSLTDEALTLFADPEGGFFDTQADSEGLIFRPKDVQDNATPSGSAMMTRVLLELSSLTDHDIYFKSAEIALAAIQEAAGVYPGAFGSWLAAFDLAVNSITQVAVVWDSGDPGIANSALLDFLLSTYFPRTILARSPSPIDSHAPTILHNRSVINNLPTAYVCHNFVCQLPTTNPDVLRDQLE